MRAALAICTVAVAVGACQGSPKSSNGRTQIDEFIGVWRNDSLTCDEEIRYRMIEIERDGTAVFEVAPPSSSNISPRRVLWAREANVLRLSFRASQEPELQEPELVNPEDPAATLTLPFGEIEKSGDAIMFRKCERGTGSSVHFMIRRHRPTSPGDMPPWTGSAELGEGVLYQKGGPARQPPRSTDAASRSDGRDGG